MACVAVARSKDMGRMIETYRGEALAWEADELGHMNMRYYFARAEEARAMFFMQLGLPNVFKAGALSSLVPTSQHIHYHREFRPGQGMMINTGIARLGNTDIDLVHMIMRPPSTIAATIVETLSHIALRTDTAFAWPKRLRTVASEFFTDVPQEAAPRNIDMNEALGAPSLKAADDLGLPIIGRGIFLPAECDTFGYANASAIIGRVSNSVQHLISAWPDLDFNSDDAMSGALLEARALHRNRPKAGDAYVMRSGLRSANTHVREICHWILDPVSGKCWSSFTGVGCRFDLTTRRLVKIDSETLALLHTGMFKGLKP